MHIVSWWRDMWGMFQQAEEEKKNLHSTEEEMVDNKKEREKESMEMHSCEWE